jgi:Uma2 family endonuclease
MAIAQRLITADELLRLPNDGMRHELVGGVLRTMSPGSFPHGRVIARFTGSLQPYVLAYGLGEVCGAETGFLLARDPDTVRAPDVAFVGRERLAEVGDIKEGYFPGAPDLAVEVVSPNDRPKRVRQTIAAWLAAGCRMVIVVYPRRRRVGVHRPGTPARELTETDVIDGDDVVPGWSLPVAVLFAPIGARA